MATQAVKLLVNGDSHEIPEGCTVEALLGQLGIERRRIAIAVNREVIPRKALALHVLGDGDQVEILQAVGGG